MPAALRPLPGPGATETEPITRPAGDSPGPRFGASCLCDCSGSFPWLSASNGSGRTKKNGHFTDRLESHSGGSVTSSRLL